MNLRSWPILFSLLISGCGQALRVEPIPSSPYYLPPPGSEVRIDQELQVPGGWARVFLQRGKVVSYAGLDRYYPSCNFESTRVEETSQRIRPGIFDITDVRRRTEEIVQRQFPRFAGPVVLAGAGPDGGPSMLMRTVRMKLHSEEQPEVYMLTCRGGMDDPPRAKYVSIDEMRAAMGNLATILLPDDR